MHGQVEQHPHLPTISNICLQAFATPTKLHTCVGNLQFGRSLHFITSTVSIHDD